MKRTKLLWLTAMAIWCLGCDSIPEEDTEGGNPSDPIQILKDSGYVRGDLRPFPLVNKPDFQSVHRADFLNDEELVLATKACGLLQVFPHSSMVVEVVNLEAHGVSMAVTFCPKTRSGLAWNRVVGSDTLLLTASGYLYRENLMPLDLNSNSIWIQMTLKGIAGPYQNQVAGTLPIIELPLKLIRQHYPQAALYLPRDDFYHSPESERQLKGAQSVPNQELGIIRKVGLPGKVEVELFHLDMFPDDLGLLWTTNSASKVVVAGSSRDRFMVAYQTHYLMEPVEGQFPVIMRDETGTLWNVFGEAVSGERGGETLTSPLYYTAADWAWKDLFRRTDYYTPR